MHQHANAIMMASERKAKCTLHVRQSDADLLEAEAKREADGKAQKGVEGAARTKNKKRRKKGNTRWEKGGEDLYDAGTSMACMCK